ncbi:MAG: hypothetical protein FWE40_00040 [Oscillospiraceae bacterium]|nr:hypothetical protein [Oscillospiraceae bacterium]
MKVLILAVALLMILTACTAPEEAPTPAITDFPMTTIATTEVPPQQQPRQTGWLSWSELALCDEITIVQVMDEQFYTEIRLLNHATGEDTLLLEPLGEEHGDARWPSLGGRLNERYFFFHFRLPESCGRSSMMIYDVVQRRIIDAQFPHELEFVNVSNGRVYLCETFMITDVARLYYFELSALAGNGAVALHEAGTLTYAQWDVRNAPYRRTAGVIA